MELNLRGRTALITGASKGIGLASAECRAAEGINVILVAPRPTSTPLESGSPAATTSPSTRMPTTYPTAATSTVWRPTIPTSTSW
jgi:NAD(P)-dependent dehydrogenase (short-subunit alcohol dehydrogenase family)